MRTTIRLDDQLLAAAKHRATEQGTTLTRVIEDALREALARRPATANQRVALPTFAGDGTQPGVNLDDSAALRDLMDAAR